MTAQERREAILKRLGSSVAPQAASALAAYYGVSRQVIVGDIALLRAQGYDIAATPRGYVMERDTGMLVKTLACVHSAEDMGRELNIMVDNGCIVRDVIVEHPIYGELTGALELKSRYDVKNFVERSAKARPLSTLTDGLHLHTLLCPDEEAFTRVVVEMRENGFLYGEN